MGGDFNCGFARIVIVDQINESLVSSEHGQKCGVGDIRLNRILLRLLLLRVSRSVGDYDAV